MLRFSQSPPPQTLHVCMISKTDLRFFHPRTHSGSRRSFLASKIIQKCFDSIPFFLSGPFLGPIPTRCPLQLQSFGQHPLRGRSSASLLERNQWNPNQKNGRKTSTSMLNLAQLWVNLGRYMYCYEDWSRVAIRLVFAWTLELFSNPDQSI